MNQNDFNMLDKVVGRVPDFPKKGILFYDITGILRHPAEFKYTIDRMCEIYRDKKIDAVAGIESRGFVFASCFAERMGIPLILIRKKGKLPAKTYSQKYDLEYGQAEIEVHVADIEKNMNILLIDDLIATGGTLDAAIKLMAQGGAKVTDVFGVIGLPFLKYKELLAGTEVTTLLEYMTEST